MTSKIVFGIMGAGKSTYAKKYAEENKYEYVNFDITFFKMFGGNVSSFCEYIVTKIKDSKNFIIDGWFAWDEDKEKSYEIIKNTEIKVEWIYVFSELKTMYDRYMNKKIDKENSIDPNKLFSLSYKRIYEIVKKIKIDKIIYSSGGYFTEVGYHFLEEIRNKEIKEEDVIELKNSLKEMEHYQNIKLPFGYQTDGYNDCEKSWNQIKDEINWNNRSVMEIGTYWGYFAFEIEKMDAKWTVATDINKDAIKIANKIKRIKDSKVSFIHHDIEKDEINTDVDIILLMNILHHLRKPFMVLEKVFKTGKAVVMEVELPHDLSMRNNAIVEMGDPIKLSNGKMGGHLRFSKEMLTRYAAENGHVLKKEIKSHRLNRTILIFER